jgi:aryl-alcohol dehydrogenase-like predicted oxidoreductase
LQRGSRRSLPDRAGSSQEGGSNGRLNGDDPYGGMLFTEKIFDMSTHCATSLRNSADPWRKWRAWVVGQPGVPSVLVGASRPEELKENVASLDIELSATQRKGWMQRDAYR